MRAAAPGLEIFPMPKTIDGCFCLCCFDHKQMLSETRITLVVQGVFAKKNILDTRQVL